DVTPDRARRAAARGPLETAWPRRSGVDLELARAVSTGPGWLRGPQAPGRDIGRELAPRVEIVFREEKQHRAAIIALTPAETHSGLRSTLLSMATHRVRLRGAPLLPARPLAGVAFRVMSVAVRPLFAFDNSYVRELVGLYEPWRAARAPAPRLLALNEELVADLGIDPDALRAPDGVAVLAANGTPEGASPVAQAYAGHQFGG